jgi:hypothetical protein
VPAQEEAPALWNNAANGKVADCLYRWRSNMIKASLVAATAVLVATSAFAQSSTVRSTPGHMEAQKPSKGPGASDYSPGHRMQAAKKKGHFSGPGASDYAPGHQTTGSTATEKK